LAGGSVWLGHNPVDRAAALGAGLVRADLAGARGLDLDNASPVPGAVKKKCHDVRRKIEDELGAAPYDHTMRSAAPTSSTTFEARASEVASPLPGDQLTVGGETFVIQGEPERSDPDGLVWQMDVRRA
jgi:hypothetical protein